MRLSLFLLLPLLCLALSAGAQPAIGGLSPETLVEIDAERLTWDEDGLVRAEGRVRVTAGTLHLAAEEATYDSNAGTVRLERGLVLVDGTFVARGGSGFVDLNTGAALLEEVGLWEKRRAPAPESVFGAPPEALGRLGTNTLEIHAALVSRQPDGTWVATRPTVTTCDCDGAPPSWTMEARTATVGPEAESVQLAWPVLYARGVPLAALPWFSVPLARAERKTGLLPPDVNLFGRRGFSWEQPLFLVLGDSYDATVSAGYFFGSTRDATLPVVGAAPSLPLEPPGAALDARQALGLTHPFDRAFRGPRFTAEFRYVPRDGTDGRAFAAWAWDLSYRPPRQGSIVPGSTPADPFVRFPVDGPHRWFVQLAHVDDWSRHFSDRVELNLASDRFYLRDFTDEVVQRSTGVLTSTAWAAWRQGPLLLAAEGVYLQDLRLPFARGAEVPAGYLESSRLFGEDRRDTFARLPAVAADLARLELPAGGALSMHLGGARFAPLTPRGFGDVGTDGIGPGDPGYPGPDPDGTEGNGSFDPGERPAANRLALRPTLAWGLQAGRYLSVEPWVGFRQLLYHYDQGGEGHAGWGVLGLDAHTELARDFAGGRVRHAWIPRLALRRLLPANEADAPVRIYDELDVRPLQAFTQARLALGTRLDLAGVRGASLEAELGQDFLLAPEAHAAESFGRASADLAPVRLDGLVRWDNRRDTLAEVAANASVTARAGHQLRLGYRHVEEGGSERLLAGPDELFAPRGGLATELVNPLLVPLLQQVSAGVTWVPVEALRLRYDLLLLPTLSSDPILEQRAAAAWFSRCNCWSAEVRLAQRRGEGFPPDVGLSLDLGGLFRI